jgi:alkylated DNA repair dioxygenase AlkB
MRNTLFDIESFSPQKRVLTLAGNQAMPNAEVIMYQDFFTEKESNELYNDLINKILWQQDEITFFGKNIPLPRLTAFYGDKTISYSYSGIFMQAHFWNEALLKIKKRIEDETNIKFNCVLLNYYRDGKDSMSWHSDDEKELGINPIIGSVSFGETRKFRFRHKHDKTLKTEVALTNGSFLLMQGQTQHFWQHEIPKISKEISGRINLTFRNIYS